MKKLLKALVLSLLVLPVIAKADMGAPGTVPYTATVVKEGGIDCYDYLGSSYSIKGHLDKEAKVKVAYEMHAADVTYLAVENNSNCLYVKATDIVPDEKEVSPENDRVTKLSEAKTFIVNANEVKVRKGPSDSYEVVGTLKKGTKGTYKYIIDAHAYVEANGIKGWVDMIGKKVLTKSKLITAADVQTKCGTIPAGTILEEVWTATNWDGESLIKYNGCETFTNTFKSTTMFSFTDYKIVKAKNELKIYKDVSKTNEVAKIPAGEEFNVIAFTKATVAGPDGDSSLPEYVEYNGVQGWVENSNYDFIKWESGQPKTAQTTTQNPTETPSTPAAEKPEEKPEEKPDGIIKTPEVNEEIPKSAKAIIGISTIIIIALCCGLALVVAVAVVAIIILVNKSNKNKNVVPAQAANAPQNTPAEKTEGKKDTKEKKDN